MTDRRPLSKTTRFEVFKRDKFTCQYCGEKAPDVVLHVDHVQPVAGGGGNDIMNLVTACASCNGGKGARRLDDASIVSKQRAQIEELEERRQQIEMMLEWRNHLTQSQSDEVEIISRRLVERTEFGPNESGKADIRRWLKSYKIEEVLAATDEALDTYLRYLGDEVTDKSWHEAFRKIPAIANIIRQKKDKPYLQSLFYIQGIIRKRSRNKWLKCVSALESFVLDGMSTEQLELIAKRCDGWDDFCEEAEAALERAQSGGR